MAIVRLPWTLLRLVAVSFVLALGRLWANKTRSALTTSGIVIAVAAVVGTAGALSGMQRNVSDQFAKTGVNRMDVWPQRPNEGPKKDAPWAKINLQPGYFERCLERCPAFQRLTRVTNSDAAVRHGTRVIENARLFGVEPGWDAIANRQVIAGRFFSATETETGQHVCCVTPEVRDKLMLDRDCVGEHIVIGTMTFLVVGMVEDDPHVQIMYNEPPRPQIILPFNTLHKGPDDWVEASLTVQSTPLVPEAEAQIRFYLRQILRLLPGEPNTFGVWNKESLQDSFNNTMAAIAAVAMGIVGISLLVGGIGIMNVMLVSVRERTREIGLRKSIGARPTTILLQFLIEAVVLCLAGGVVGLGVGWVITRLIAGNAPDMLNEAYIPFWAVEVSLAFSTGVGLVFGMLPAIKAARLNPIDALRHE